MEKKVKQLLSDTLVFAVGNALSKIILFLLMPLYTYTLTTAEYGISDTLSTLVELILPIATLCISDAVFRFSIDCKRNVNKQTEIFSIGINILIKGTLIVIIAGVFLNYIIKYKYIFYLIAMYITYSLKQLFGNFIRGLGKVKLFAVSGILSTITLVLFNFIFLLQMDMGIKGYLLSIVISNTIGALFIYKNAHLSNYINLKSVNKIKKRDMLEYSVPVIPNMVSWWFNNTANRYILLFFHGANVTGLFSAANKLPAMINLLSSIFQQAWQYSSASEYKDKDKDSFYSVVFKCYSSFILVACSLVIVLTPLISRLVLQGEFYIAWRYVPLLLLSATLGCYSIYFGGFYTASKNNKMLMISTIIGTLINICTCLVLVPVIGVYGVLIANNLCYLSIVLIRAFDTRRYVNLKINWSIQIISIIIIFIQAIYETIGQKYIYVVSVVCFFMILTINFMSMYFTRKYKRY